VPKQTQANISFAGETADSKLFGQFFIVSDENFHHFLVLVVVVVIIVGLLVGWFETLFKTVQ
jgi:hypothetical protein